MEFVERFKEFFHNSCYYPVKGFLFECVCLRILFNFLSGFTFAQAYYHCFLKKIPYVSETGANIALFLSILLGLGNIFIVQVRCITLLVFPMYCGKPGRGVLKAVLLSYVVAGPITNMGLNAQEVVRVFACSTHLPFNISKVKYNLMVGPMKTALLGLKSEINEVKDTLSTLSEILSPIEKEIESTKELEHLREKADMSDERYGEKRRTWRVDEKYEINPTDEDSIFYQKTYMKKMEYRCEDIISRGMVKCNNIFWNTYEKCGQDLPDSTANIFCPLVDPNCVCSILFDLGTLICDSREHINTGLGQGYSYLERAKNKIVNNNLKLRYQISVMREIYVIQRHKKSDYTSKLWLKYKVVNSKLFMKSSVDFDEIYMGPNGKYPLSYESSKSVHPVKRYEDAKETGAMVIHAFEEKRLIMRHVITILDICMALLFLRIAFAAVTYHDLYLINIEYDNIFVTDYFKKIDLRRRVKGSYSLLPLKKMERSKYIDVHSPKYRLRDRNELLVHLLKVMLEVVTATTFVMLDRLFYEALDVVRQHAEFDNSLRETANLEIEMVGNGFVANLVRRFLSSLKTQQHSNLPVTNGPCLPRPRPMPPIFYLKIYGGYLWVILLLGCNSYTSRLKRLICSHYYPRREKQRILHLYNDILKNRLKMDKTLRRRAVRAVRAHYLSGETLLSARMRFPKLLGWLEFLPTARMKCTICGETQPRKAGPEWHCCLTAGCGFVWCGECWREAGACLACDATLVDLSDIESLSDDELPKY